MAMNSFARIAVVVGLLVAIGAVMAVRQTGRQASSAGGQPPGGSAAAGSSDGRNSPAGSVDSDPRGAKTAPAGGLPRLVDLGAGRCIPCRQMAPILDQLRREFAGRFEVEFIDVWENPAAAEKLGVRVIPTQIFYDADGRELFRHEGFYGREDILGKWKDLGVSVEPAGGPPGR